MVRGDRVTHTAVHTHNHARGVLIYLMKVDMFVRSAVIVFMEIFVKSSVNVQLYSVMSTI